VTPSKNAVLPPQFSDLLESLEHTEKQASDLPLFPGMMPGLSDIDLAIHLTAECLS
jgi:hypothetical protein